MEQELVSIVIPVYNREDFIRDALDSAINQTYKNIEIVVVDNCSTDGTWKILENYAKRDKRILIFRNDENIGPVNNWIECFKKARGNYIKILWSDDWMSLEFVEKALRLFDETTAFVMSGYEITDKENVFTQHLFNEQYSIDYYLESILLFNKDSFSVSPGCALFRTKDVIGNFYPNKVPNKDNYNSLNNGAGNDLLLFLNIAKKYTQIKCLTTVDNYFREHSNSFSSNRDVIIQYEWTKLYFLTNNKISNKINNAFVFLIKKKRLTNRKYENIAKEVYFSFNNISDPLKLIHFFWKYFSAVLKEKIQ